MSGDRIAAIRAAYAAEQENPPLAIAYGDIPVSYGAITADWLTLTLGRAHPEAAVAGFRLDVPDQGTSNRRRIFIEWNAAGRAAGLPASVFCKASHDLVNRIILSAAGAHSEVTFYNEIRPLIDIEAPRAFFAAYDPVSYASIVVLEDMAGEVTYCSSRTRVTRPMVEDQLDLLATLHGRFYDAKDAVLGRLYTFPGRFTNLIRNYGLQQVCENGFAAAEPVIPARLFARAAEIWPATLRSVERNAALPPTVAHGDVHLGNWYRTHDGRMGLGDWQAVARGHWSRDLAYVLATALAIEDRRAWERDLVERYLDALSRAGGPVVGVEDAWIELRRQSFTALAYWTMTLTPSGDMPDMQTAATTLEFIGRLATMMDDHDALGAFQDREALR
jgi:aminoglycoside phosphotransferase (APT) family kinase protein